MDDALIPKSMGGGLKIGVQIGASLSVILVVVSIICAFIKGAQMYYTAYVVIAIAMGLLLFSTGILVRWIVSDELPESKHSYVVGFQFLALMVMSCGLLASVYMTLPGEFAVYGFAGNSSSAGGSVHLKGVAVDGSTVDEAVPFGSFQPLFKFTKHIQENSDYTLNVIVPSTSQQICSPKESKGSATADVAFQFTCQKAYSLSGICTGLEKSPVCMSVDLYSKPPITLTQQVSANGDFTFQHPILEGIGYKVGFNTQPTDASCSVTAGESGVGGKGMAQVVVTCVKK